MKTNVHIKNTHLNNISLIFEIGEINATLPAKVHAIWNINERKSKTYSNVTNKMAVTGDYINTIILIRVMFYIRSGTLSANIGFIKKLFPKIILNFHVSIKNDKMMSYISYQNVVLDGL